MTLIEVLIVVAIIGALTAMAVPSLREMQKQSRAKGLARDLGNSFQLARSEAMRTGGSWMVFFGPPGTQDPAANPIQDAGGTSVPLLILQDDNGNCHIDGGEDFEVVRAVDGMGWGVSSATVRVSTDTGAAAFSPPQSSGSTFADPSNTATDWVMFRPDGVPVGISGTATTCGTVGDTGSGGAALYVTNGFRDYAVVVTALGGVRVHGWDGSGWTQ